MIEVLSIAKGIFIAVFIEKGLSKYLSKLLVVEV